MHSEYCVVCFFLGMLCAYVGDILAATASLLLEKAHEKRRNRKHDREIAQCTNEQWEEIKKILQNKAEDDKL